MNAENELHPTAVAKHAWLLRKENATAALVAGPPVKIAGGAVFTFLLDVGNKSTKY